MDRYKAEGHLKTSMRQLKRKVIQNVFEIQWQALYIVKIVYDCFYDESSKPYKNSMRKKYHHRQFAD